MGELAPDEFDVVDKVGKFVIYESVVDEAARQVASGEVPGTGVVPIAARRVAVDQAASVRLSVRPD